MVIKLGRYGKFYACSNFPDCHNTKAITKEIGVTCPTCGKGQVIERKTKRNRVFYGCDRYPDCEFTSWDIPVGRNCPKSGDYLVEKKVRGGGKQVICSNEDVTTKNLLLNKESYLKLNLGICFLLFYQKKLILSLNLFFYTKDRKEGE